MSSIDLGFTQKVDPNSKWKLKNKYFPSKIGGKPVFLDLEYLPKTDDLKCLKCQQMMRFLLQIYAPIDTKDNAFHRTLFVFCCVDKECNQFKVLRSQLSRDNPYYSSNPPDYENDDLSYDPKPEIFGHNLCFVCGLDAKNKCSKCLKVSYCSKQHQTIDWKEGNHRQKCGTDSNINSVANSSALFDEMELSIDVNGSSDGSDAESIDSESERKEMEKYNELMRNRCPEYQKQNFDKYEDNISEEQKVFNKFKRLSSEEVIRYCTYEENGPEVEPLWISSQNKPNLAIPECKYCGSKRRFEFQIMPQLLNQIVRSDESLDWGTLVVYTCAQSCSSKLEDGYKEEYIWNQTFS